MGHVARLDVSTAPGPASAAAGAARASSTWTRTDGASPSRRCSSASRELAIPPAWEDVWICPYPMGHIQATGTDAAGRKQYRYHDHWRERRDREKFESMEDFARCAAAAAQARERRPGARRHAARARAGLRDAAARPRLLPDRLARTTRRRTTPTGSRRCSKRHVTRGRRRGDASTTSPRAASAGVQAVRRSRGRRGRDARSSAGAAGGEELLAWREGRRWRISSRATSTST